MASPPKSREDVWPLETPAVGRAQGPTEKEIQTGVPPDRDSVRSPKLSRGKKDSSLGKVPGDNACFLMLEDAGGRLDASLQLKVPIDKILF